MNFKLILLMSLPIASALADGNSCMDCSGTIAQFNGSPVSVAEPIPSFQCTVSCNIVDYGTAIRSDYQAKQIGAVTQAPSALGYDDPGKPDNNVPVYAAALQKYYGVRGLSLKATCRDTNVANDLNSDPINHSENCAPSTDGRQGISLFQKFTWAVKAQYPSDPDLVRYVENDLTAKNSPQPGADAFAGSCQAWSAWSMDPDVQAMLSKVGDGIFCGGMTFTKGELRELITATYPDPQTSIDKYTLNKAAYLNGSNALTEQANIALTKLGTFANNGSMSPSSIIQTAQATKNSGDRFIIDLDPGTNQVWNQPVETVLDVEYLDPQMTSDQLQSYLTGGDLGPANSLLVYDIKRAEADITSNGVQGYINTMSPSLLALRNQMAKDYPGLNTSTSESLTAQVDELKSLQGKLIQKNQVSVTANQVTKHRLFMKYAPEAKYFGQNHPEAIKSEVRALDYVTVNGRSSWSPPTENLSQACADGNTGTRVQKNGFGLVEGNVLNNCANGQLKPGIVDHPIATGAFPPKEIDVFHQAKFDALNPKGINDGKTEPQKLFNHLRDMILNCDQGPSGAPTFDTAAKFLNDFDTLIAHNELGPNEIAQLKQEFTAAQNFLDPTRAQRAADGSTGPTLEDDLAFHLQGMGVTDTNAVPGLNALYNSLSL